MGIYICILLSSFLLGASGAPGASSPEEDDLFGGFNHLDLDRSEISEMMRNVTAQAETPGCPSPGKCQTPLVLWMLKSLLECESILRKDCPKGLVCCEISSEKFGVVEEEPQGGVFLTGKGSGNGTEVVGIEEVNGDEDFPFNFPFEQSLPLDSEEIL